MADTIVFQILHYGDRAMTRDCVRSILALEGAASVRILVVDNDTALTRGERLAHAAEYEKEERVTFLRIRHKAGFSRANNIGYAYVCRTWNPAALIICNNDVLFPEKTFLTLLRERLAKEDADILAPDILHKESGKHQNPLDTRLRTRGQARRTQLLNRAALFMYPLVRPLLHRQAKQPNAHRRNTPPAKDAEIVPNGACLIFCKGFLEEQSRAFLPETAFYYEEYILAARCRKLGKKIRYAEELKTEHLGGIFPTEDTKIRRQLERMASAARIYAGYIGHD